MQLDFYRDNIGLELCERTESTAVFNIGSSRLKLIQRDRFTAYHFAINIPCNQENEALSWLKDRVDVLLDGNNEIQDFSSWNAKAIYFYDADKNIVEFIARRDLKNERETVFNVNSMIGISEIGMPVSDIKEAYSTLNGIADLEIYDGDFERFCAIGEEHGLFICLNKELKDWFPTGDTAHSSDFRIKFEHKGNEYEMEFSDGKIHRSR